MTAKAGVGGNGVFAPAARRPTTTTTATSTSTSSTTARTCSTTTTATAPSPTSRSKAGLADPRWSLSAVWLDYDRDGYLDVFVGNYLQYDDGKFRSFYAAAGYPGPLSYNGQPDALYRNNGDGTFTDVTKEAGVFKPDGRAMSVTAADLNNDGWLDIYVANDAMENYYFENTGKGTFAEKALELGLAFGENGQGVSSMGPVVGDVDRDGQLDIFIPDMDYGSLLVQSMATAAGHSSTARPRPASRRDSGQYTGWGAVLFDYDNDGWLDVFIANGNAHHEYVQEDALARNNGNGTFVDVSRPLGRLLPGEVREPRRDLGRLRRRRQRRPAGREPERPAAPAAQRRRQPANHWLKVDAAPEVPDGHARRRSARA